MKDSMQIIDFSLVICVNAVLNTLNFATLHNENYLHNSGTLSLTRYWCSLNFSLLIKCLYYSPMMIESVHK
jgi:hypothetical protein